MKTSLGAHRHVAVAVVVIVAGLTIAACGSSSNSGANNKSASAGSSGSTTTATTSTTTTTTPASGGFAAQRAKLTACLKAHGVTLPSRPAGGYRGGYGGAPGSGGAGSAGGGSRPGYGGGFFGGAGAPRNSKFSAAFKACAADFPAAAAGRSGAGRARFTKATLDAFVTCVKKHGYTLPKPNTSGKGPVFPASIEHNAKFEAAAKSCTGILSPPGPASSTPPASA